MRYQFEPAITPQRLAMQAKRWQHWAADAAAIGQRELLCGDLRRVERWQVEAAECAYNARKCLFQLIGAEQP